MLLLISIIVLLLFLISLAGQLQPFVSEQVEENFESLPAGIRDNIGDGVPGSWANKENQYVNKTQTHDESVVVYHGPIPLNNNANKTTPFKLDESLHYFHKHKASPDCCPSPFMTDHGCVCWNTDMEPLVKINEAISPRS